MHSRSSPLVRGGETVRPLRQTANGFGLVVQGNQLAILTRNTATSQASRSTPIFQTNTRLFTPKSLTLQYEMQLMFWTACFIMSRSELQIEEHYTDTAGFTDHVFGLMHVLGFRFAPRIRDLKDKKLYVPGDIKPYPTLANLIGGGINMKHIRKEWNEVLRLAASIKQGTVTALLMLKKLGAILVKMG